MQTGYPVIDFRQFGSESDDDRLLIFAAPANAVASWAGIPQKGWHLRMLYQRWVTKTRENQLINFWNTASTRRDDQPKSYILGPTALTIAIHKDAKIVDGKIYLEYESIITASMSPADKLAQVAHVSLQRIQQRLTPDKQQLVQTFVDSPMQALPKVAHDYVLDGSLQIAQMANAPDWFIETNKMNDDEVSSLTDALEAMCRPALVVDGQHRLFGAANCANEVWLPVVAIPNCPWSEQIYQFVVINEKAQRVETSLLTDIFGSSLTTEEQMQLRKQLERSNVSVEDRIAAVIANRDSNSPFYNMVKVKLEGPVPFDAMPYVPESAIRLLINGGGRGSRGWRNDDEFYEWYVRPAFPDRDSWEQWTNGAWRDYWFAFWQTIGEFYNKEADDFARVKPKVWDVGRKLWDTKQQTNLTKAVTLRLFQTLFMDEAIARVKRIHDSRSDLIELLDDQELAEEKIRQKVAERALPDNVDEFRNSVREWFLTTGVPVRTFIYPWKGSLDDPQGQQDLAAELRKAYNLCQSGKRYRADSSAIFASGDDE